MKRTNQVTVSRTNQVTELYGRLKNQVIKYIVVLDHCLISLDVLFGQAIWEALYMVNYLILFFLGMIDVESVVFNRHINRWERFIESGRKY